jgi:HD-like signal output (HDOD) protein
MDPKETKPTVGRLLSEPIKAHSTGPVQPGEVKLPDLARAIRAVPVAPEVLPKLQSKLRNLDTDSADLAELIRLDAGLASSMLKTSNSAYYARAAEVTSVDEAVSLIGYQETMRLVARCSFSTVMQSSLDHYGLAGDHLWRSAVLTAFAMEELCAIVGADVSVGYIAGLLHGVGMVAINDYLNRRKHPVAPPAARSHADFVAWESATIGYHHGQVGAAMMRGWQLPALVASTVERQFEEHVGQDEPVVHCLLPLAIAAAQRVIRTSEGEAVDEVSFDPLRMQRAGLEGEHIAEAVASIAAHWEKAKGALA